MSKIIIYWWYFYKISLLENKLSQFFLENNFDKTKKTVLWYIASKDIDYSMFKVYDIWGIDSLTEKEKKRF